MHYLFEIQACAAEQNGGFELVNISQYWYPYNRNILHSSGLSPSWCLNENRWVDFVNQSFIWHHWQSMSRFCLFVECYAEDISLMASFVTGDFLAWQFPSLRVNTWRNNGSNMGSCWIFEHHIRFLRVEWIAWNWNTLRHSANVNLTSVCADKSRCNCQHWSHGVSNHAYCIIITLIIVWLLVVEYVL